MSKADDYRAHYQHPRDVLADTELDRGARRAILEQWRLDALRRQDSAQEGMAGPHPAMLAEVDRALRMLRRSTDHSVSAHHSA